MEYYINDIKIIIEKKDLEKILDEKYVFCIKNQYIYLQKGRYTHSLAGYILNKKGRKVYFKKDKNDFRYENLTTDIKESYNYVKKTLTKEEIKKMHLGKKNSLFTKSYSDKLKITQTGELNTQSYLNWDMVNEIRKNYTDNISHLAKKYNLPRTTVADIINYRTWNVSSANERIFKKDNIITIDETKIGIKGNYENINLPNMLLQTSKELIYIEKLEIERLIYVEFRTLDNKYLFCFELFFPEIIKKPMKIDFILTKYLSKKLGRKFFIEKALYTLNLL